MSELHSEHFDIMRKQEPLENLVEANINLVWKIVDRYRSSTIQSFDDVDIFQRGMMGLIKATKSLMLPKKLNFLRMPCTG